MRQKDYKPEYDGFEHLCESVFAESNTPFFMLTLYVDDSGTDPRHKVVVVAGYLSSKKLWDKFKVKWTTLLYAYDINELHRTDLEAFQGEFKSWNGSKRTEFLQKAHKIIKDYTYTGIGACIVKNDFDHNVPENDPVRKFCDIYGWCAHECIAMLRKWADSHKHMEPIQVVLEAGTSGHGRLSESLARLYANQQVRDEARLAGWSFQGKAVLPLQAADTIAYEYYRIMVDNLGRSESELKFRLSAEDLFRPDEVEYLKMWDTAGFNKYRARRTEGSLF